jgi:hypothetical protein
MGSISSIIRGGSPDAGRKADDRGPLRDAVKQREKAEAAVENHREAITRARSLVVSTEKAVERAAESVASARKQDAKRLADAVRSDAELSGTPAMRAARATENEAIDGLQTARDALTQLTAELPDVDAALAEAQNAVRVAVFALIAPLARSAFKRLKELDTERDRLLPIVRFVQQSDSSNAEAPWRASSLSLSPDMQAALDAPMSELREQINQHAGRTVDARAAARSWNLVAQALSTNADAPLPEIPTT